MDGRDGLHQARAIAGEGDASLKSARSTGWPQGQSRWTCSGASRAPDSVRSTCAPLARAILTRSDGERLDGPALLCRGRVVRVAERKSGALRRPAGQAVRSRALASRWTRRVRGAWCLRSPGFAGRCGLVRDAEPRPAARKGTARLASPGHAGAASAGASCRCGFHGGLLGVRAWHPWAGSLLPASLRRAVRTTYGLAWTLRPWIPIRNSRFHPAT